MTTRTRRAAATVAVAALTALPACATDDSAGAGGSPTSSASAATTSAAGPAAAASEGELEAVLTTFFDPAVPAADKAVVVEDGDDRGTLLEQFNGVLAGYPLTADVESVNAVDDDTVSATVQVTGPHGGAPMPLTFEREDGTWRLADESTCQVLAMGSLSCS
ncbi:lipoprotein [Rhodococcus rhodochrous]|nr:lipoprotein [Rhodococcus rhodochrous]